MLAGPPGQRDQSQPPARSTAVRAGGCSTVFSVVLAAEFVDEAAATVTDLPALVPAGAPARKPRRRAHAQATQPGAGWVPTPERFRDPASRVVMRVWIDPADQSRHYVPEPDA